jgi:hypothetical protein
MIHLQCQKIDVNFLQYMGNAKCNIYFIIIYNTFNNEKYYLQSISAYVVHNYIQILKLIGSISKVHIR